jgi:hypothetical protein
VERDSKKTDPNLDAEIKGGRKRFEAHARIRVGTTAAFRSGG